MTQPQRKSTKKKKVPVAVTPEEAEQKKEMHRRCESRRRERVNQYYDQLNSLLRKTSFFQSKKTAKLDRCSLIKYITAYIRELQSNVNALARFLSKLCTDFPELASLLPEPHLRFILQTEFVDDDVCMMLAAAFGEQYYKPCIDNNNNKTYYCFLYYI